MESGSGKFGVINMPILNLTKIKKEEAKEEVPDELPSLPPEEVPKVEPIKEEVKQPETPIVKQEASVQQTQELAPDELPPLKQKEDEEPVEKEVKQEERKLKILDERLYFSQIIRKLNNGTSLEEIENELKSHDVISRLYENINKNNSLIINQD